MAGDQFTALRKFVIVAGVVVALAFVITLFGLAWVAKKAQPQTAPTDAKKDDGKTTPEPKPDPYASVTPEQARVAREIAASLDEGDFAQKIAEGRARIANAPSSQVLALVREADGDVPERRIAGIAAVIRPHLDAWADRSEGQTVQHAWEVLHEPLDRIARRGDRPLRIEAVRAFSAFPAAHVSRKLYDLYLAETDPELRRAMRAALERRVDRSVYGEMLKHFEAETDPLRACDLAFVFAEINRRHGEESFRDHVEKILEPRLRGWFLKSGLEIAVPAARAMAAIRYDVVNNFLIETFVRGADKAARIRALEVIGETGREEPAVADLLADALRSETDEDVLRTVKATLEKIAK